MTKNKQNKLTHSDYYIYWAKKEEWSLTEAVYLLHGFVPPGPELAIDQLIKVFPDIKRLVENLPERKLAKYLESPEDWALRAISDENLADSKKLNEYRTEKKLKKFTPPPKEWVIRALYDGMAVTDCWKLIYPKWIPHDVNITFGKILDWPRFIKVLGTNTKTSLKELVRFALNLYDKKMAVSPRAFDHLLDDMATRLNIKTNSREELREWRVRPKQFMERCLEDNFAYDSECQHWYNLLLKHPKIAKFINLQQVRKQQTEVTYVVTEYLKATDYKGGMPGLKRFMVDVIHAEFISADNKYTWTDPECTSYTKSKSRLENCLSELKREHALKN